MGAALFEGGRSLLLLLSSVALILRYLIRNKYGTTRVLAH